MCLYWISSGLHSSFDESVCLVYTHRRYYSTGYGRSSYWNIIRVEKLMAYNARLHVAKQMLIIGMIGRYAIGWL